VSKPQSLGSLKRRPAGLALGGNPDDLRVTATHVVHQPAGCAARLWAVAEWWPRLEPWPLFLDRASFLPTTEWEVIYDGVAAASANPNRVPLARGLPRAAQRPA
jgi:hypothetical protein